MATTQPNNYGLAPTAGGTNGSPRADNAVSTSQTGSGSQTGQQTGSQTGTQTTSGTTTTSTSNMTPEQLQLLNGVITMLMGGGTPDMRAASAARINERSIVSTIRNSFSKDQAFLDAAGLMNQQNRRSLERLVPSINRAAEDAGSSGGALRALLLQDAANKAGESAAALGAQQASQYGQIQTGLSQVMENLTRVDPALAQTLVGALGVAKGSVSNTTQTTNQTTTNNQQSQQNTSQQNQQQQNGTQFTDYAPLVSTTPTFYGTPDPAAIDPSKYVGSTLYNMAQLSNQNPWANRVTF